MQLVLSHIINSDYKLNLFIINNLQSIAYHIHAMLFLNIINKLIDIHIDK